MEKVEYLKVGNIHISRLTLGTAQLGSAYGIANRRGKQNHQNAIQILNAATVNGVNCFDTAPSYGDSEKIIGQFISSCPSFSQAPVIITKVTPLDGRDGFYPRNIRRYIRENILKSMKQLKIKTIPIYLLHGFSQPLTLNRLIIDTLLELKEEGLIGVIGVSIYNPEEVEYALSQNEIGAIQIPINIFDQRLIAEGLLQELYKKNLIVFARSIFLQGLFFLDAGQLPSGLALAQNYLRELNLIANELQISIAELAVSFVRDLPGITSLVIGAETPEQVQNNVELLMSQPIDSGTREEIASLFLDTPEELVNPSLWNVDRQVVSLQ